MAAKKISKETLKKRVKKDIKRNWSVYLVILPIIIYYLLFEYIPMYGVQIAFQDYRPTRGFGENWVGFKHFIKFVENPFFFRLIRNTFLINWYELLFSFPVPIIIALLYNELKSKKFKTVTNTLIYLPHFISLVVVCSMIQQFCSSDGFIAQIVSRFTGVEKSLLAQAKYFRTVYIGSGIWQSAGWGSIIYVAALQAVDTQLYDAAAIDGANKWRQMLHVTLPGIVPTIMIKFILNMGSMLSVGSNKILLLYNDATLETADVISTYVHRYGLEKAEYSYSTAIGLFNNIINVTLFISANKLSKKATNTSLW